jgi:hypothetical protein
VKTTVKAAALRDAWSRLLRERQTAVTAGVAIVALAVGATVQSVFPPEPAPLIVLAGSSEMGAESYADIGLFVDYEYVAGADLSDEAGTGTVYELALTGDPRELLDTLGSVFGVEGSPGPSQFFDDLWPGYVLGPEDWTGPMLNLTWSGTGPWYYSDPAAYQDPVCREIPADEGVEEPGRFDCDNPEPRGPLPSVTEARVMASELLALSGLDIAPSDIQVLAHDEWGVGLSAIVHIDGQETALEWSVFYAPGPVLASVSGHAATPVSRGTFDLVSPVSALDRLKSGQWWGSPAPEYHSDFDAVFEGGLAGEEYTLPEPGDVVTLTVTSADSAHLLVWDAEGTAWIVPGYVMRHGAQPWNASAVIAVRDGVIELPEPVVVEPLMYEQGE